MNSVPDVEQRKRDEGRTPNSSNSVEWAFALKPLPSIDLSRIRAHGGAQDRGFEEFAYILAWDLADLESGTAIERRATPDGGIEFSCKPSGKGQGGRWAWQAKYLFKFDASTFAQMTKSVVAALASSPDLERYIFVLPKDRSTAAIKKWQDAVVAWKKLAAKKKMTVEFDFCGESDLIRAAARDRHAGAIRYFFDTKFLTQEFMLSQVSREVRNLGERYSPDVHVETEARDVVDAACRSPRFVQTLRSILEAPIRRTIGFEASTESAIATSLKAVRAAQAIFIREAEAALGQVAEPGDEPFRRIRAAVDDLLVVVKEASDATGARIDGLREESRKYRARRGAVQPREGKRLTTAQAREAQRQRLVDSLRDLDSSLWRVARDLEEIPEFLAGPHGRAASSGAVLLVGQAGCGKSHLVADLAIERVEADMPSALTLGQHLVQGAVDPQLVELLGTGTSTLAETLSALDVSARVRRKGRALVVVDAINEGPGGDVWAEQLPGLVELFSAYPWVALVLTIRDTYESWVVPKSLPISVERSVHRGLAGHEEEALSLYASHYGLRLPDVPSLLPELSNPLFLRSLCQSVKGRGLDAIPREASSLVWVFDGLIEAVDATLRKPNRLNYADWQRKVPEAVRALATALVDASSESLPISIADSICQAIHPEHKQSLSLLYALTVEGLVLRERVVRDGVPEDSIRFTYQRLSDHLRAEVLLDRYPTDAGLAAAVRTLAKDARWVSAGLIAALVLLAPEKRGKELASILRYGAKVVSFRDSPNTPATWLRREVQQAFVDTIMWRSAGSFTDATTRLLRLYLREGVVRNEDWLRTICGLACLPGHPLNTEWLHPILWDLPLAERDEIWSRELDRFVYSDDANPISRTVDWAWENSDAPEEVARLASVFLAWLFSSTNRRLRDTATKAAVSVTTNHPVVVRELVTKFAHVNDPYILDRVVAVAYGHVLRTRHLAQTTVAVDDLRHVGEAVFDAVFDDGPPVHLMIRHRARMCVLVVAGVCEEHGKKFERDVRRLRPTYDSSWPLSAPSVKQLAKGFGRENTGHVSSSTELDWEFTRNLKEHILDDFVLPNQTALRRARRATLKRQLSRVVTHLSNVTAPSRRKSVANQVAAILVVSAEKPLAWPAWQRFQEGLPKTSRSAGEQFRAVVDELSRIDERVFAPDFDVSARWIAARILDLGWTKERFGEGDERLARTYDHNPTERVAKKYERIAFQELCGHLVDNCLIKEYWRDAPAGYEGPWQIHESLDIDPSLLVRGDEPEQGSSAGRLRALKQRQEAAPTWWRTAITSKLIEDGSDDAWLSDAADIPEPQALLVATDPLGREWLALERHQEWAFEDVEQLTDRYGRSKRRLWMRTQANVIRADDSAHGPWAANVNWMGLSELNRPGIRDCSCP